MQFDILKKGQTQHDSKNGAPSESLNYRLAKFFLENSRLTILALLLLLTLGLVSTFSLKTTGFPAISIPAVEIQTTYPGATSQTVAQDVTIPIEGKIKNITGVESYASQSSNSFSVVSLTLDASANADTVSSKVTAALQSLTLPTGVQTPTVSTLSFTNPTLRISLAGNNLGDIYTVENQIKTDLGQNQDTASVTAVDELNPEIIVTVDPAKLAAAQLSETDVQSALHSVGTTHPIASDLTIEGYSQSLSTTLSGTTVDDIKQLPLRPATSPLATPVPLSQVANVSYQYVFATQPTPELGYNNGSDHGTLPAVTLVITAATGTDTHTYTQAVRSILQGYSNAQYVKSDPIVNNGKVQIVEQFSADDSNQTQVSEVSHGLIGGPLPISNKALSELGWLLGGVQLVFLVMMALVSWRAALVSSLAIPLSLLFSSIYLHAIGSSFNTIVLFSFVLAIGLVVDPALVVLEAIQRKIDAGHRGKEAVLAAVKDIGSGLFIATVNNIIVFAPFGLVSGAIGQIFGNIPATIIPALVGSYIVPLIFLAWLGGIVLRPGKRTSHNEEENLWPFAQWLIRFNQNILDGSVLRRVVLILLAASIPVAIAGYFFGTGKITVTEFSGGATGTAVEITGTFKSDLSKEQRQSTTESILEQISSNQHLGTIYSTGQGFSYEAYVKTGDTYPITSLQSSISNVLSQYQSQFFDTQATVNSTTGPVASYQIEIAVASDNPATLQNAAIAVGQTLSTACLGDKKKITFTPSCSGTPLISKVDNGYTGQEDRTIQVIMDRTKLAQYGLDAQGATVTGILSSLFPNNQPTAAGSVEIDESQVNIYLNTDAKQPTTVAQIEAIPLPSANGTPITLGDVATVIQGTSSATIQRNKGQTEVIVQGRLVDGHTDQATAGEVTSALTSYYNGSQSTALGLAKNSVTSYSEGGSADFAKSFVQLLEALALAIFATYFILVIFFNSFLQPIVILFTIPLTFIGIFPALYYLSTKQFGFFEIIGMIILVGLVDNVAIFLIDAARQRINEGVSPKTAIAHASGIRLRPVILTKAVALASLAPLAFLSLFYRSISLVIIFGLLTSGLTSLFTTPILFIFFRWLSDRYAKLNFWNKILFIPFSVIYVLVLGWIYRAEKRSQANSQE